MISRTTRGFWKAYDALPEEVRAVAERAYRLWRVDMSHPSLRFKCVSERHNVYSIRVGIRWRALGYRGLDDMDRVAVTWFWIGSHAEYDQMISSL